MKKKVFGYFIGLLCCISAILCLSACDGEVTLRHMHTFSDEWTSDESNHWHAATCGHTDKISGVAQHTFENDICTICLRPRVSVGLSYSLNEDKTSYSVTGAGTCTDTDIIIPAEYKDLPVTGIADRAFKFCSFVTGITLPDGVTSIGNSAFNGCSALTSITIPDSVTIIGDSAFWGCTSIEHATMPAMAIEAIPKDSLTGVVLTSGDSIGRYAFANCSALTSITIPDTVTSIGGSAFYRCSALTEISFNGTVEQWNAVSKGTYWDSDTGDYTVYCTNGETAKEP